MKKLIGWIGTGVMGNPMCGHLVKNGYKALVFNRTASKADSLLKMGGVEFHQPQDIAAKADYTFLMLGHPQDVERTVLGNDGILQKMRPGSVLIDHTTSSPDLAERISEEAAKVGVRSIDAPVSGGDVGARAGQLVVMCGGEKEALEELQPVMAHYAKQVELFGGPGKGQHVKAINQIMIGANMMGIVEAILYSEQSGVDAAKMIELLKGGAAGSTALAVLGPRMLRRDFDPGFYVEHLAKDLKIILEEASKMNLSVPATATSHQLYRALIANGGGKLGTQALLLLYERLNNMEVKKYDT